VFCRSHYETLQRGLDTIAKGLEGIQDEMPPELAREELRLLMRRGDVIRRMIRIFGEGVDLELPRVRARWENGDDWADLPLVPLLQPEFIAPVSGPSVSMFGTNKVSFSAAFPPIVSTFLPTVRTRLECPSNVMRTEEDKSCC
jgi:hypothetical protein